MRRYLFSRAGEAVIVLLIVSLRVFIYIRLLPGDPAMALYGDQIQKLTPGISFASAPTSVWTNRSIGSTSSGCKALCRAIGHAPT